MKGLTRRMALQALSTVACGAAASKWLVAPAHAQRLLGMSALQRMDPDRPLPLISFTTAQGVRRTLTDYAGHGLVVNIWATWCGPCVAELPGLNALAPRLAPEGVLVLPISVDAGGAQTVEAFYKAHRINHLPILLDPSGNIIRAWRAPGIPMTVIFNKKIQPVASLLGGAEWNSSEALRTIAALAGTGAARSQTKV